MEVILLERIGRLGNLGDKVSIKPGYARNFLIPKGKAIPATETNIAKFELRRAELEKAAAESFSVSRARADALQSLATVTMTARAADEGRLYGSIGPKDLAHAITAAGVMVQKSEVCLPNGPLRILGEHEVSVQLHSDINVTIKIIITPEA